MSRLNVAFGLAALLLVADIAPRAETVTFHVRDPHGRNLVTFESQAPLETVFGTTNRVTGSLEIDPEDPSRTRGTLTVELDSLDTGIVLRNEQMRSQYLETKRYPTVRFDIEEITMCYPAKLKDGPASVVTGRGTFHLHGVTRPETFTATVRYLPETEETRAKMPGNLVRIAAEARLRLSHYDIPVPQLVALKLDETIRIRIDVTATDASIPEDE